MMRRRAMRRGPGLVGTVARTAVIAGTATVASNAVSHHQQEKAQAQAQEQAADQAALQSQSDVAQMQEQLDTMQAQQTQAAVAPAAPDLTSQLKQLADLKAAGVLSDAEFEAAKAKVLGA